MAGGTSSGVGVGVTHAPMLFRSYSNPGEETSTSKVIKKGGKMLAIKIVLLDETVTIIQAQAKAPGRVVFDEICKQLNVLESDYFGLRYHDTYNTEYWLDMDKKLCRQVGLSQIEPILHFNVKFYPPDPSQLEEEFTRYLFTLQIKQDLARGRLICNDNTIALMASYIVQAECGDFNEQDYPDSSYLNHHKFVMHQDYEMENKIRENHMKHVGQSPGEADLHLLETARRTEMYGIRLHTCKDEDGLLLNLSVSHQGILVFQNTNRMNTFSWGLIRKLSFKRKKFIVKLHECVSSSDSRETLDFYFSTRNDCKSFWKICVEHHSFFRCPAPPPKSKNKLLTTHGSSFRYSGRTQRQMISFLRENFNKREGASSSTSAGMMTGATTGNTTTGTNSVSGSASLRRKVDHPDFIRSASFRSDHISTSCSSPGVLDRGGSGLSGGTRSITKESQHGTMPQESDEPDDDTVSTNSPTSSPYNYPDPDWFYYITRELLNTQRSFLISLKELNSTLLNSNSQLTKQLELYDVKKELWEKSHGVESIKTIIKHFDTHYMTWSNEIHSLDLSGDKIVIMNNGTMDLNLLKISIIYRIYYYQDFINVISNDASLLVLVTRFRKVLDPLVRNVKGLQAEYENSLRISELVREMPGFPQNPGEFVRYGILLKYNQKKGLQNRLFVLTRDILVYGTRISSQQGFRLHGLIPLYNCSVQANNDVLIPNSFSLCTPEGKIVLVSALSDQVRLSWLQDLDITIRQAKPSNLNRIESSDLHENNNIQTYNNSIMHVCWHRNLSVGAIEINTAVQYSISGYLLRKFKNSPGWQRLYVVYNYICLYFYKSHEDSVPLATLPLLGYKISTTIPDDQITKDNVFKICYKSHVYYFRAESPFTFKRWFQVLQKSTGSIIA